MEGERRAADLSDIRIPHAISITNAQVGIHDCNELGSLPPPSLVPLLILTAVVTYFRASFANLQIPYHQQ